MVKNNGKLISHLFYDKYPKSINFSSNGARFWVKHIILLKYKKAIETNCHKRHFLWEEFPIFSQSSDLLN